MICDENQLYAPSCIKPKPLPYGVLLVRVEGVQGLLFVHAQADVFKLLGAAQCLQLHSEGRMLPLCTEFFLLHAASWLASLHYSILPLMVVLLVSGQE